jgi:hypothetical protein
MEQTEQLTTWISSMTPDAKSVINKFIAGLDSTELELFYQKMWSYKSITELQANYKEEIRDPFSQQVFLLEPKGIGAGEIWLSWLIKDVQLSGGGESYDIEFQQKLYEVKAYNFNKHHRTKKKQLATISSPWRLGNAGAMSNFKFVEHLLYNAEIAHKIANVETEDPEIIAMQSLIQKMESMSKKYGMVGDFARGEISGKKLNLMIDFIVLANKHVTKNKNNYDIITFSSTAPGNPDVSYLIKEQSAEDLANGKFEVIRKVDLHDLADPAALNRMLVRSLYIREGIELMVDHVNEGISKVEQKYAGIDFIVFRKEQMNITPKLAKIEERSLKALKSAIGNIFTVSSASVRVKEQI